MLELLISIMMTLKIHYTVVDDRHVQISDSDAKILSTSVEFQRNSEILPLEDIVIINGVDPSSSGTNNK
jgi:hypothetical protein